MNINDTEIERKFLIEYPDKDILYGNDVTDITQTYLISDKGSTARVRKRGKDGVFTYTHTVKTRISDIRRMEIEHEISEAEYEKLLKNADPGRNVISKRRCCIDWDGHVIEIDVYPFWSDRAIMEIELLSEDESFTVPPYISIIKEVTSDRRYTNASLAKCIPYED